MKAELGARIMTAPGKIGITTMGISRNRFWCRMCFHGLSTAFLIRQGKITEHEEHPPWPAGKAEI
jgi:hypothetical protein